MVSFPSIFKQQKKDSRGRPSGVPNKMCGNCVYYEGDRIFSKGFINLDRCSDKNAIVAHIHCCEKYLLSKEIKIHKPKKESFWKKTIKLLVKMHILEHRLYWRKVRKKKN